jgi:predicted DNA-binding ribbon-helix-helix protein
MDKTAAEQPRTQALRATRPVKRSFSIAGHRTSISLEAAFWDVLKEAADSTGLSVAALVGAIDRERGTAGLSGAVRVWVLEYALRQGASAAGKHELTAPGTPRPSCGDAARSEAGPD